MTPRMTAAKILILCSLSCQVPAARAQVPAIGPHQRTEQTVSDLAKELRWTDAESHKRYDAIKDQASERLLTLIDEFVTRSVRPGESLSDVKAVIDKFTKIWELPSTATLFSRQTCRVVGS